MSLSSGLEHASQLQTRNVASAARFTPLGQPHLPDIPGYRILRPLGQGGMATVYLAVQESLAREVALKVLAPELAQEATARERFLHEARTAAKLRHPNIIAIHDVGTHDGVAYMAMEYEPGGVTNTAHGIQ